MSRSRFANSLRKYIRAKKVRIRQESLNVRQQQQRIIELYRSLGLVRKEKQADVKKTTGHPPNELTRKARRE